MPGQVRLKQSPCIHLSHAATAADGGIAVAVSDLQSAQGGQGLESLWLTADRWPAWCRDRALLQQLLSESPALVHLHGLWRSPTRIASGLAAAGVPLLIAPHGMLDAWSLANSRWKKRLVWALWERRALESARCLHALCPAEAKAIRALGLAQPVAVIPNGVAMPDRSQPLLPPPWAALIPEGERVLLFLGRFHAKKGTAELLASWRGLIPQARRHGWWLSLVGYGDGGELANRVRREGLERCLVLGPCFGRDRDACFAHAAAFVLPSHSEGLPMAALEAMSWRLPSLLSSACNLPEAFEVGAALRAEPTMNDLDRSLQNLFNLDASQQEVIGAAGLSLVSSRYGWPSIARQTIDLYHWLLGGGERPASLALSSSSSA